MKDKDLLKLLLKNGWTLERVNGSHHIVRKDSKTEVIEFCGFAAKLIHGKDVPTVY